MLSKSGVSVTQGICLLQGNDPQLAVNFLLQGINFDVGNTFHNKKLPEVNDYHLSESYPKSGKSAPLIKVLEVGYWL